jgi:inner membrane protein
MPTLLQRVQTSVTGKVLFVAALVLVLLIPLGMIAGIVQERAGRYASAAVEVAQTWGKAQTVGGPILVLPIRYTQPPFPAHAASDELYLLPERLAITGDVDVETRRRGIYRVPVYTAKLRLDGRFALPDLAAHYTDLEILWSQAQIALPMTDARTIREPVRLTVDDATAAFEPGGTRVAGFSPQLVAAYAELGRGPPSEALAFSLDLTLAGTDTLEFLPLAGVTDVSVSSNWPSPRFGGSYLPAQRAVTADGFTASWRVLDVGRGFASRWRRSDAPPTTAQANAFGVDLITPVGVHESTLRAAKYGVLFIGLSFAAYFLFELLAGLRLHPLQYLLIGSANCVFYLLLLALAEHVGFGVAYASSALASTVLIGSYSAAVLRTARRALPVAALLGGMYAYLYVTLRAEDYALLLGALGTFASLAGFMYATRRVDWYAVTLPRRPGPTEGSPRVQLHA